MTISASKTIIRAVVPKTVAATIGRMAVVTGKSRSAIISEFLTEAEPAIRRLAGMLEVAKSQRSMFPGTTVAELEAALDELSGNATEVMDRVQSAMQLPLEPAKQPPTKRPRGGRATSQKAGAGRRRRTPA